jgi:hypothetical protein
MPVMSVKTILPLESIACAEANKGRLENADALDVSLSQGIKEGNMW